MSVIWPYEKDAIRFFGQPGENQTRLELPFPLRYEGDHGVVELHHVSCNTRVKDALARIWDRTLDHYGHKRIVELRLDVFGGCLNVRRKRGGSEWSMHAFGAAWDVDPARNQLHWGRDRAALARPEYDAFWQIVEAEGAVSLGRTRNFDWMHFQFARP
jgi:hypothetical protein